jgi:hypothetical protein
MMNLRQEDGQLIFSILKYMFQVSMDAMENCLPFHRRRNDHSSRATVFPFADSNLIKVEHKFSASLMNMISKSIKPRLEKDSMNFKSWILLWNTLGSKGCSA